MSTVPFFFYVVHPQRFLRNIGILRRSRTKAFALDMLAFSGLGWLAIKLINSVKHRGTASDPSIRIERFEAFSDWADDLWDRCKPHYGMSAVRDSATLQLLYPKEETKFIRLRLSRGEQPIGWAVLLNTQLSGHKQFGKMRLGSLVDCLAAPDDAPAVVHAARHALECGGVDLIVTNQSHTMWIRAMRSTGFLRGPSNFIFAASPLLADRLAASNVEPADMHLNRGDGDGPINL